MNNLIKKLLNPWHNNPLQGETPGVIPPAEFSFLVDNSGNHALGSSNAYLVG